MIPKAIETIVVFLSPVILMALLLALLGIIFLILGRFLSYFKPATQKTVKEFGKGFGIILLLLYLAGGFGYAAYQMVCDPTGELIPNADGTHTYYIDRCFNDEYYEAKFFKVSPFPPPSPEEIIECEKQLRKLTGDPKVNEILIEDCKKGTPGWYYFHKKRNEWILLMMWGEY